MKLAFLFPGQGSQAVGMGRDLMENSSQAKELFQQANELLGYDLTRIMFEGPEEELKQTKNTQPALFLVEVAYLRELEARGVKPAVVAGHSIGEYAALVAAGVLTVETGLALVRERANLMQAVGEQAAGSMAAVLGLDDDKVAQACADAGGVVVVANYNSPGQVVISGETSALQAAIEKCKAAGARRALPLPVSGAFHSPLLVPACEALAAFIDKAEFKDATVPVVTNVDGQAHTAAPEIAANLRVQMASSVRWTQTLQTLSTLGVDSYVEIGPGNVLAGLAKRTLENPSVANVGTWDQLQAFPA